MLRISWSFSPGRRRRVSTRVTPSPCVVLANSTPLASMEWKEQRSQVITDEETDTRKHMNKIVLLLSLLVALHASAFVDASLQTQLGNPSNATPDTNNHNHYLIQRAIEALDYNDSRGQANWASWDLTSGDANNAVVRQDSYAADTSLPANFYEVGASEYSGSGFDRGHLYMANCHSSGDWQFKQPVAMALPTVILKASCLRCWAACFLPGRVAG